MAAVPEMPVVIPQQPFSERLLHNAEVAVRSGSTWFVAILCALAAVYLSFDEAQKDSLLTAIPWLATWKGPLTVLAAYVVTRVKPSNAISTQTAALLEEVARLRMNEYLKSKGIETAEEYFPHTVLQDRSVGKEEEEEVQDPELVYRAFELLYPNLSPEARERIRNVARELKSSRGAK